MLLLRSFFAAMNITGVGLSKLLSIMSSRAVLALATKSLSVRSVEVGCGSNLSKSTRICLSAFIPLAIMSACSFLVVF